MKPLPQPNRTQLFTAGSIIQPNLVVVTLERDFSGAFHHVPAKSAAFTLEHRSTASVRMLRHELQAFATIADIRFIALSAGQEGGQYPPGSRAFKIETILQLVDGLQVEIVNTKSVTNWVSRTDPSLPGPSGRYSKKPWLTAETRAIEMAAFAAVHAGDTRYFPEQAGALASPVDALACDLVDGVNTPGLALMPTAGASHG